MVDYSGKTFLNGSNTHMQNKLLNACAVVIGVFGLALGGPYDAWDHYTDLTLNTTSSGAGVSGTVNDFPVLVRLTSENFDFGQALAAGADLRFSDATGNTALSYEIEHWDATGQEAAVWVLVPSVQGNNSTQKIRMYWGKADAADASDAASVFAASNGFAAVWHLGDDLGDASSNGNDGTNYGSAVDATTTTIGKCRYLDGNDRIDISESSGVPVYSPAGGHQVAAWIRADQNYGAFYAEGHSSLGCSIWEVQYKDNRFGHRWRDQNCSSGPEYTQNDATASLGQWHYVVCVQDGNTHTYYLNGSLSGTPTNANSRQETGLDQCNIGVLKQGGSYYNHYKGRIDELRISTSPRSTDWIKLSYNNQKPADISSNRLVEFGAAMDQENYSLWSYSTNVTLNTSAGGADVSSDITGFPVLVRLNSSNFDFSQAKWGGVDIRFSNSTGDHLPYQIDTWDNATQEAGIWVKTDMVYGNNSTQYIVMHWGKADAASKSSGEPVFTTSGGFTGVWHLSEGGTGTRYDATANNYDGTPRHYSGNEPTENGIIGNADSLEGGPEESNPWIELADGFASWPNGITLSAWVKPAGASWWTRLISLQQAGQNNVVELSQYQQTDSLMLGTRTTGWSYAGTRYNAWNQWHHIVATVDASGNGVLYKNGAQAGTGGVAAPINVTRNDNFIGRSGTINDAAFLGIIDEVRVENVVRSADWNKLAYENQKQDQTLVTIGPLVDTDPPTVASVTASTANGTYGIAAVVSVTVQFNEPVNVTGAPGLTLETGATDAGAGYVSGSGTSTLTFE
ncbi:MAG: DUF2341 domain-containing protein, partial [Chitinivibrionales bacterium]|nr:DUF2341 domain-containing protein [Chitinivibrionales bacterium]MBD3395969.1 DUF2341 domain-containing protein [Chitinivibrionales bacterium]